MKRLCLFPTLLVLVLMATGCEMIPFLPGTPLPPNSLSYDAPVSLSIKVGQVLPGTSIGYGGKTPTGAAKLLISGISAAKQVGDSLDWQGSPAPNANVKLSTRVVSFDEQAVSVVGTAEIDLVNTGVQPGGAPGAAQMDFNAPVTYALTKGKPIPGSNVVYVGSTVEGAQFSGIDGYSFRKTLDSLQYIGRLTPKVYLKLDLRVLNFSDSNVLLGGTANVKIE